ncbi:O-methyltransferase [Sphingobacterium spiritivorum]|uniref:O-methyltransferase n=1 Tax=Sphingobacterium spiritivorum TaxID=258 RepID=UPI003DA551DF
MLNSETYSYPDKFTDILLRTRNSGFNMASDIHTGSLLKTLAASKPNARFLELGTGTGLSTSWLLSGMDERSALLSVDHDPAFLTIAQEYLSSDPRLTLVQQDAGEWLLENKELKFDFIFADTWHGKFLELETCLAMLDKGGIYFIDDLLPQPNWPDGHDQKVRHLIRDLDNRADLSLTRLHWSTGVIVAVKR